MSLEVRVSGSTPAHPDFVQVEWADPTSGSGIKSSIDPWLSPFPGVSDKAVDLVRLAGAAYVADRMATRGAGFSRSLRLHVQLIEHDRWAPVLPKVEQLLSWVSGDVWELSVSIDSAPRPDAVTQPALTLPDAESVALFSGGLDSFSGAVLASRGSRVFLSHTENPTVTGAQTRVWRWLTDNGLGGERVRVSFREVEGKRESTTRTRAVLFYALAVALADSRGLARVEVPENGFTGLNLSLGNDRGGVLSTRSTHPWTMHLVASLLRDAELSVQLTNPYEWYTKGELISGAATVTDAFAEGAAMTLSCAKLDGRTYKGGNPNLNCGLCVACLTRRASLLEAGIEDNTPYLATTLSGGSLGQLWSRRGPDMRAVMTRLEAEIDEFVLLENGPYPDDFDLSDAADLCRRGLSELAALLRELA